MTSLYERENLLPTVEPKRHGFTPRHIEKLASKRLPKDMVNIECSHFLRLSSADTHHGNPPLAYRLWLEAGKHPPPFPERPDENYNSTVWRNFSRQFGFHTKCDDAKIGEMIAAMYPLSIPAPSKVGDHTYSKYLHEIPIIRNERLRKMAIDRNRIDIDEFKKLRVKSDSRNPPLDEMGNIIPPMDFDAKLLPKFIPPGEYVPPPEPPKGPTTTDIFGQKVPVPKKPYTYKLSYKLNNPQYDRVQKEIKRRQEMGPRLQKDSHITLELN